MSTPNARVDEEAGFSPGERLDPLIATAPHRIGKITLTVRDLERVSSFYQDALGLVPVDRQPGLIRLGTGARTLIELHHDQAAQPASRTDAGLFHTAFLLPTRSALGAWLTFAIRERLPLLGASDHLVSEAVYLADPEGNGIEIYSDRPSSDWRRSNGMIAMTTKPLDVDNLMNSADREWAGFPPAGLIGHVHLKVGDIAAADAFYGALLGLKVTSRYPGASFFGSGGYHHQLAANVWTSRGAPLRPPGAAGLTDVEIVSDERVLDTLRSRLPRDGSATLDSSGISLSDPWGTRITLRPN